MVVKLAAWGPLKRLTWTSRTTRIEKWIRDFTKRLWHLFYLLNQASSVTWRMEIFHITQIHAHITNRHTVLGLYLNSGPRLEGLRAYLAPLLCRLQALEIYNSHTSLHLSLQMCVQAYVHMWCIRSFSGFSSCIRYQGGRWILLQQFIHRVSVGVCTCLCVCEEKLIVHKSAASDVHWRTRMC